MKRAYQLVMAKKRGQIDNLQAPRRLPKMIEPEIQESIFSLG